MFKTYIIIFFFIFTNLSAEIIQKLEVEGNSRISKETIKVYGEINFGKDYSAFGVNKILKNLYDTNFFEDIKISLDSGTINIIVKEYPIINFIELRGEKSKTTTKKVLSELSLKNKQSFISNKLVEDIKLLKKIYGSIGYNFANVEAKIEKFDNDRVNLIYILDKGEKTYIQEINFIGDKKIKEKRLRDIIASEEKTFWKVISKNTFLNYRNIELDKRLLINYYKSLGYYDVQVLSSNATISEKNLTSLTYTINAGTRYKVNKISTNVSDVFNKSLFLPLQKNFKKVVGKYYSPFTVKKLLDEVDILIANNDLQFVEHSVSETLEGETIEIKINIFEGAKLLVERIDILGNSVTDESVIRSELLLDEGDPFNKLKLDQSIAKLKARKLFGEVKNKIIEGANKDQKIIEIAVEENPTGEISVGAGVGTNGGSFAFSVNESNWLGKGVNVNTSLDVSKESFTGLLAVSDPNYKFSGNSLDYFVSNTTNDKPDSGYKNNIITTGIGTQFEQYKNIYLSPGVSLSYDDLQVDGSASEALKKQKGSFTDLSLKYQIALDNRDRVFQPTAGHYTTFAQKFPVYADSPYLANSFTYNKYKTFTENYMGAVKFFATSIDGLGDDNVRLNNRVNLSSNRLRGFKAGAIGPRDGKDYVGGNYAAATNFELNLPNLLPEATKTDIGFFLDLGNVWHVDYSNTVGDSNKLRSTAGINTSWSSPVGPMSFIISQNLSKATSDATESFNFRLGSTF